MTPRAPRRGAWVAITCAVMAACGVSPDVVVVPPTPPATDATTAPTTGGPVPATNPVPTTNPSPTSTAPPTTAVSIGAGDVVEISVASGLAGSATTLVAVDTAGALHVVDLAASTDTVHRFRPRLDGRRGVLPVGSSVLVPSSLDGSSRLVASDGSDVVIDTVADALRSAAETGTVWDLSDMRRGVVRALDATATPTGLEVRVPDDVVVVPDPAGGLLVVAGGTTTRLGVDEPQVLADGALEAAGVAHLLLRRCGDLGCRLFVLDRARGTEREVPIVLTLDDEFQLYGGSIWSSALVTMSPDGRFAAFLAIPAQQYDRRVGLLDTTTGEFLVIAAGQNPDLFWSPDGRFAFVIDSLASGILTAFDITTGEAFVVSRDLPTIETFAVLPTT